MCRACLLRRFHEDWSINRFLANFWSYPVKIDRLFTNGLKSCVFVFTIITCLYSQSINQFKFLYYYTWYWTLQFFFLCDITFLVRTRMKQYATFVLNLKHNILHDAGLADQPQGVWGCHCALAQLQHRSQPAVVSALQEYSYRYLRLIVILVLNLKFKVDPKRY